MRTVFSTKFLNSNNASHTDHGEMRFSFGVALEPFVQLMAG